MAFFLRLVDGSGLMSTMLGVCVKIEGRVGARATRATSPTSFLTSFLRGPSTEPYTLKICISKRSFDRKCLCHAG